MGIRNESFMKLAAVGTWMGDFVTAWMVRNFNFTHSERQLKDMFVMLLLTAVSKIVTFLSSENKFMSVDKSRECMQSLLTSGKKNQCNYNTIDGCPLRY